jgi:hypothetical protein
LTSSTGTAWYHGTWEVVVDDVGRQVVGHTQQEVLLGELADPALVVREVRDVRRAPCGECIPVVVEEGRLMVFPLDGDARIRLLEPSDRVLDVVVERRRQVEGPERDLGAVFDALDDRLGIG